MSDLDYKALIDSGIGDDSAQLRRRIKELEAENEQLRELVAVYVDPTGMDRAEHDLVIKCALGVSDE